MDLWGAPRWRATAVVMDTDVRRKVSDRGVEDGTACRSLIYGCTSSGGYELQYNRGHRSVRNPRPLGYGMPAMRATAAARGASWQAAPGQLRTVAWLAGLTRKQTGPPVGGGIGSTPFSVDNAVMPRELFRFDTSASVADFSPIDDRVMGGRSASRLRHDPAGHAPGQQRQAQSAPGGAEALVRRQMQPAQPAQRRLVLDWREGCVDAGA